MRQKVGVNMNNKMTLLEAKERFFPEYKYALVGFRSDRPVFICKTIEEACELVKDINRHCYTMVFVIELNEEKILEWQKGIKSIESGELAKYMNPSVDDGLREYRCSCGRLLGRFNGQAEVKCPKCGKMNVIGVENHADSSSTR